MNFSQEVTTDQQQKPMDEQVTPDAVSWSVHSTCPTELTCPSRQEPDPTTSRQEATFVQHETNEQAKDKARALQHSDEAMAAVVVVC